MRGWRTVPQVTAGDVSARSILSSSSMEITRSVMVNLLCVIGRMAAAPAADRFQAPTGAGVSHNSPRRLDLWSLSGMTTMVTMIIRFPK